jgi:hypothetical protein
VKAKFTATTIEKKENALHTIVLKSLFKSNKTEETPDLASNYLNNDSGMTVSKLPLRLETCCEDTGDKEASEIMCRI